MATKENELAALAALAEPQRRRLYLHVVSATAPVSRVSAAGALGVPRSVAAFHLDKLAELGLLEVEYRRPEGRAGPGAGRPAKLYRRSTKEVTFNVPERRYDVAASLLAAAIAEAGERAESTSETLTVVARDYGRALSAEIRGTGPRSSLQLLGRLATVLAAHGYEPRLDGGVMTLENCPFHALAEEHRELVCGMNHEVIASLVEAAGMPRECAELTPHEGRCCVTVRAT